MTSSGSPTAHQLVEEVTAELKRLVGTGQFREGTLVFSEPILDIGVLTMMAALDRFGFTSVPNFTGDNTVSFYFDLEPGQPVAAAAATLGVEPDYVFATEAELMRAENKAMQAIITRALTEIFGDQVVVDFQVNAA